MAKKAALVPADRGAIQLLFDLEAAGAVDEVSLTLTDRTMAYDQWEGLGRFLGSLDRRSRWYVGDWLNFGEEVYGEQAAQGVDDTTRTRYSEAERVTGLEHGTLMNIRTVCAKVARSRRRSELGFWIHSEVTSLEPDEQTRWLQKAIDEAWTRAQLRQAIRTENNPGAEPPEPSDQDKDGMTVGERIEAAARLVWHQAQRAEDGSAIVPAEAWAQLSAALGEG